MSEKWKKQQQKKKGGKKALNDKYWRFGSKKKKKKSIISILDTVALLNFPLLMMYYQNSQSWLGSQK